MEHGLSYPALQVMDEFSQVPEPCLLIVRVTVMNGLRYHPHLECRAIAVQFMDDQIVVLFELARQGDDIKVVEERHYRLVPAEDLKHNTR